MTAALRKARATGVAKIGRCILAEMGSPYRSPKLKGVPLLSALRVREIEALIRHRHGHFVPDASGTDDLDTCHGYILSVAGSLAEFHGWSRRWLPWLDDEAVFAEAEALRTKLANGKRGPRVLPADAVAGLLLVSMAERSALALKTIGACDVPKKQRCAAAKARKRQLDCERQQAKRRAEGRTPRAEIAATSIESEKPWLSLGISRRAWFYRKKRCTAVSRIMNTYNDGGDTPVQFADTSVSSDPSLKTDPSRSGEGPGFGDQSPTEIQEPAAFGARDQRRQANG